MNVKFASIFFSCGLWNKIFTIRKYFITNLLDSLYYYSGSDSQLQPKTNLTLNPELHAAEEQGPERA